MSWRVTSYKLPAEPSRHRVAIWRELRQPVVLAVAEEEASVRRLEALFTAEREAEWGQFIGDCGTYEAELASEVAKGKLTLAELDEEEQSLDRLRRWSPAIRTRDLFGAASAADAERRPKECAEAMEGFAKRVYRAREQSGQEAR